MATNQRLPLGIELVKRGIVKQEDITQALEYQMTHPKEKLGDILNDLRLADPKLLLNAMGDVFGEKVIYLTDEDVKIDITKYISVRYCKRSKCNTF